MKKSNSNELTKLLVLAGSVYVLTEKASNALEYLLKALKL